MQWRCIVVRAVGVTGLRKRFIKLESRSVWFQVCTRLAANQLACWLPGVVMVWLLVEVRARGVVLNPPSFWRGRALGDRCIYAAGDYGCPSGLWQSSRARGLALLSKP